MIGALARKLFGTPNDRRVKGYQPRVAAINALEGELEQLTNEFRKELADGKTLDDILVPAFATVREAAKRTLGQRHFDVQLIGGMVLHEGNIAEMKTGEGKPLGATRPVFFNALSPRGEEGPRGPGRGCDAAGLSQRAVHPRRPCGDGQRLPRQARFRMDGAD